MLEAAVKSLDGSHVGVLSLSRAIFGLEVRNDILHRVVRWQMAKRQSGNHKTKGRSEINRTGRKMYKQKGTGGARHGSASVAQFRGGGKAHGPIVRDHSFSLPKKIRSLGLRHALSSKFIVGSFLIIESECMSESKTKFAQKSFESLGFSKALIITGSSTDDNFRLAARNLAGVDILPVAGLNVYDILRSDFLVMTKDAVLSVENRFSKEVRT